MWIIVLQRITLEFVLDIIYFPLWWYTAGAKRVFLGCIHLFQSSNSYLAPGLWLKNIFVPMYAQYDIQGRLVSFLVRLGNVIVRSIGLLFTLASIVILFFLWILFPVTVIYMFVNSLL